MAFRLSSVQRNALMDASKVLEHESLGAVAMLLGVGEWLDSHHGVRHDFLATAHGEKWLQRPGQQVGCLVIGVKQEERIQIYTYDNSVLLTNAQDKLAPKVAEIRSSVQI